MRVLPTFFALCFAASGIAGCGDDGGAAGEADDRAQETCAVLDDLAGHALAVEQVNVADPDAFEATLDDAADAYADDLERLREVAPEHLDDPVDDVRRAVDDHDFEGALAARAPIDDYAAAACVAEPTSTSSTTE